jgi:hypothetical protein
MVYFINHKAKNKGKEARFSLALMQIKISLFYKPNKTAGK